MPDYRIESCAVRRVDNISQDWTDLQQRADCSYFQSWGWVGTWLERIAGELDSVLVKVWFDDELVGMGLFITAAITRRNLIHSTAMFLNEYPFEGKNMVIEHNGLLAARGYEKAVYEQTVHFLLNEFKGHDEFMFGAIAEGESFSNLSKIPVQNASFLVNESSLSWFVDLARIPADVDGYLASLSKNRRAQIRRSWQLYENQGPLQIEEAQNAVEALAFFDGLKELHTHRWHSKGQRGAFANPSWEAFHRSLIQQRFDAGEIQLLKVSNGAEAVGYLYNFVWRKRVYVLQTGFGDLADKRLMPGYVTHVLAILHNKSKGMSVYDLMHGDSLYKRLLCNQSQRFNWMVLQRRKMRFIVENAAVYVVRGVRSLLPGRDTDNN